MSFDHRFLPLVALTKNLNVEQLIQLRTTLRKLNKEHFEFQYEGTKSYLPRKESLRIVVEELNVRMQ